MRLDVVIVTEQLVQVKASKKGLSLALLPNCHQIPRCIYKARFVSKNYKRNWAVLWISWISCWIVSWVGVFIHTGVFGVKLSRPQVVELLEEVFVALRCVIVIFPTTKSKSKSGPNHFVIKLYPEASEKERKEKQNWDKEHELAFDSIILSPGKTFLGVWRLFGILFWRWSRSFQKWFRYFLFHLWLTYCLLCSGPHSTYWQFNEYKVMNYVVLFLSDV